MTKTRIITAVFASLLIAGGAAIAQRPKEDVSPARHPNLAEAQELIKHAWQKVLDAQKANEWDMNGHAQKAKEALDVADREIKLAAEAANRH
jgi:hypothetical protein